MPFTKTLTFSYTDLPKRRLGSDSLIFIFDDERIKGHEMYLDFFPVVWKVVSLQAGGKHQFSVTYRAERAFATVEVEKGVISESASSVGKIDLKQQTTLTGSSQGGFQWSPPQEVESMFDYHFSMKNETGVEQGIAVCNLSEGGTPEYLLYSNVQDDASFELEPPRRLRIYSSSFSDYEQGRIIKAQMTHRIWDCLVDRPGLADRWVITYDLETGRYEINPEE